MAFSGEHGSSPIERKTITAAIEQYKMVRLQSDDEDSVQKTTTTDANFVYGRSLEARTSAQISAGLNEVDIEVVTPGTQKTVIAGGVISTIDVPVGLSTDGKVVALSANSTPITQFSLGRNRDAASADGDEIIIFFDPKYIEY